MKKTVLPFFSFLLVITLVLSSFSSASADYSDDPWVTPVSGDLEFNTTIVPLSSLPGTIELSSQMLVPAGFAEGEVQFGGNGVRITGFDGGKATICYSLTASEVAYGWGGKVGSWDGAKWALLPTSIAPVPEEGSATSACATIYGNGTYTFIKYVADVSLLPNANCPYVMETWFWEFLPDTYDLSIYYPYDAPPYHTPVTYEVLVYAPDGSLSGTLSGVKFHGYQWTDFMNIVVDLETFEYAIMHIEYPGCSTNLTWHNGDPIDWYLGSSD
jgi:hypothetical protein